MTDTGDGWHPGRDAASRLIQQADESEASGDWQRAEALFREAFDAAPEDPTALVRLGMLVEDQGRFEESARFLQRAADISPRASISTLLGSLAGWMGHETEAERHYRDALKLDPEYDEAHLNLGGVLEESDPQQAKWHFRRTFELDPACALAYFGLGRCLVNEGKLNEGRAQCEHAAELAPDNAMIWAFVGRERGAVAASAHGKCSPPEQAEHYAKAEAGLRHAIQLNPACAWSHLYLGLTFKYRDQPEEAEALMRRAIRLGDHGTFGAVLGDYFADLGRFDEAYELFRQVNLDYPNDILGWRDHGRALIRDDRQEEHANLPLAIEMFETALALDEDNPASLYRLGDALSVAKGGDLLRARALLERAVQLKAPYLDAQSTLDEVNDLLEGRGH